MRAWLHGIARRLVLRYLRRGGALGSFELDGILVSASDMRAVQENVRTVRELNEEIRKLRQGAAANVHDAAERAREIELLEWRSERAVEYFNACLVTLRSIAPRSFADRKEQRGWDKAAADMIEQVDRYRTEVMKLQDKSLKTRQQETALAGMGLSIAGIEEARRLAEKAYRRRAIAPRHIP